MTPRRTYLLACLPLVLAVALLCKWQVTRLDAADRSSLWPSARALHLRLEPQCAGCGAEKELEVHHVMQFNAHPELELEQTNMITLCRAHGTGCHWHLGHGGKNWRDGWPDVRKELGGISNSVGYKVRMWREEETK